MDRGLSVGGVFGTAFSVFRERARVLVPIGFATSLAVTATSALLGDDAIGLIVVNIVDIAFFALVTAVAMGVLRDLREGRPDSSARELLVNALPPLPAATLVGVLGIVGVLVGTVLLIVPGLILMTIWAVTVPVVVVERQDVFDAFGRSQDLVHGNGWKVFGILLLLGLIILGTTLPFAFLVGDEVARRLIGALVSSFVTPFEPLVLGALYYRLRDLERLSTTPAQ